MWENYYRFIRDTSYTPAHIRAAGGIGAAEDAERAAGKMFAALSQEERAGSTSVFSWLGCILLQGCLFWAPNTGVSDRRLGKQTNKQANIDCGSVLVYMCQMCLLLIPNSSYPAFQSNVLHFTEAQT